MTLYRAHTAHRPVAQHFEWDTLHNLHHFKIQNKPTTKKSTKAGLSLSLNIFLKDPRGGTELRRRHYPGIYGPPGAACRRCEWSLTSQCFFKTHLYYTFYFKINAHFLVNKMVVNICQVYTS